MTCAEPRPSVMRDGTWRCRCDRVVAEARAAAWAWYGRRLALVLALEDVGVQSDLWPVALGWFEEECAAIDAWLLRGPSWLPDDFPEVLRG